MSIRTPNTSHKSAYRPNDFCFENVYAKLREKTRKIKLKATNVKCLRKYTNVIEDARFRNYQISFATA